MKVYDCLIQALANVTPEHWDHPLGHPFSAVTVNGVRMVLYYNGWIGLEGRMYTGWPFANRKGRSLYKRVRIGSGISDNKDAIERETMAKLGFTME